MKYTIISFAHQSRTTAQNTTIERVNDAIEEGWSPQGGIAYTFKSFLDEEGEQIVHIFSQAMVKDEDED